MKTKTETALWRLGVHLTIAILIVLCVAAKAEAQTVPGSANLSWALPTLGCDTATPPVCTYPLTGANALTAIEVYVSTSPIPDNSTMAPTLTLAAGATTTIYTTNVINGQTLYARVKAVNAAGKSPFSNQASKPVVVPVLPGVPTSVTITLTIG